MRKNLKLNYDQLGWRSASGDNKHIMYLRQQIVSSACHYRDADCLRTTIEMYDGWMQTGSDHQ